MYEHVTHHKTISFSKSADSIINESINVPRRSMKGLLLLFYEPYAGGARDSEKTFNPDITEVKVTVNGIPNKIFSQGMKTRDFWEEIFRRFGKENSSLDATGFYAGDRFALFVDLRSMKENNLRGSGLRLVNTKEGVQLSIKRNTSGLACVASVPVRAKSFFRILAARKLGREQKGRRSGVGVGRGGNACRQTPRF